jgi:hypothetical protein
LEEEAIDVGGDLEMVVDTPNHNVKDLGQSKNDIICFRCKEKGHTVVDCKLRGQHNMQNLFMDHSGMVNLALCKLIVPLCAT